MRFLGSVGMSIIGAILFGCASTPNVPSGQARYVLVEKNGGIVALPRREMDRAHALYLIKSKCGPRYEITREEEIGVGEVKRLDNRASSGEIAASGSSIVVREKMVEYRLTYVCK